MIFSARKLGGMVGALLDLGSLLLGACESASTTGSTSTTLGAIAYATPVAIVFRDQEGGATLTKVWVMVDPDDATRATNDAIFCHAVALAEEYGAADATEGRLRVELSDAPNGEFIKNYIIESRDFDLRSTTPTESSTITKPGSSVPDQGGRP